MAGIKEVLLRIPEPLADRVEAHRERLEGLWLVKVTRTMALLRLIAIGLEEDGK